MSTWYKGKYLSYTSHHINIELTTITQCMQAWSKGNSYTSVFERQVSLTEECVDLNFAELCNSTIPVHRSNPVTDCRLSLDNVEYGDMHRSRNYTMHLSFPSWVVHSLHGSQEWWLCLYVFSSQSRHPAFYARRGHTHQFNTVPRGFNDHYNPLTFLYVIMVKLVSVRLSITQVTSYQTTAAKNKLWTATWKETRHSCNASST